MKASAFKYTILSAVATMVMLVLVLMPFHAFLTVWLASHFGHYTALRLWKELILVAAGLGVVYLMLTDHKIRTHTLSRRLVWLIAAYAVLQVAIGLIVWHNGDVTTKALLYGWLVDLRFLVFFLICWAVALRTARLQANWFNLLIFPALAVALIAVLQATVLPHDVLRHFGYGPATIEPLETINHNQHYLRVMSTLRGANPLGAYLILPITALVIGLCKNRRSWRLWLGLVLCTLALYFSHSRSAFLGALLAAGIVLALNVRSKLGKQLLAAGAGVVVVLAVILSLALHNNADFQNVVLHTQTNSSSPQSSNDGHVAALKSGLHDIRHRPFGAGPGTAGPASIYNDGKARIAEDYFIQLGQEVGIVGMLLFIIINAGIGYLLWLRRQSPLAMCLLASLIGLTLVNCLLHAWADDTVAYVWWGLAGMAMATLPITETKTTRGKKQAH
ncbi:MAG: hypothetical protein JWN38_730 [Candidatus Saccharibacteria bacterium]|nr:hypothetical protein [Candidatus Saccharibacteria bacterium]